LAVEEELTDALAIRARQGGDQVGEMIIELLVGFHVRTAGIGILLGNALQAGGHGGSYGRASVDCMRTLKAVAAEYIYI
jgi:hypothetical protein